MIIGHVIIHHNHDHNNDRDASCPGLPTRTVTSNCDIAVGTRHSAHISTPALPIARRNFYQKLSEHCELGHISVGAGGIVHPMVPIEEIERFDDGTLRTLIHTRTSVRDLF